MRGYVTIMAMALWMLASAASAQDNAVTASEAWIAVAEAGASTASAYAVIENPTMYDVYVVKVECDAAGSAAIVTESAPVSELAVPSFGSATLEPGKPHIELKGLKKPLKEGDRVPLTLTTDQGDKIEVEAVVRKPK